MIKDRELTNWWDKLKNEIKNTIKICVCVVARTNAMMIIWGLLVRLLSTGIQGLILKNTVCVLPHHSSTFLLEARDEIDLYSFFQGKSKTIPCFNPNSLLPGRCLCLLSHVWISS